MSHTVVFDLGKVLVDFDYSIAAGKIAALSSKAPKDLHAFLGHSPLLIRLENGEITRQEFFDELRNSIGFCGTILDFSNFFADIFQKFSRWLRCTKN